MPKSEAIKGIISKIEAKMNSFNDDISSETRYEGQSSSGVLGLIESMERATRSAVTDCLEDSSISADDKMFIAARTYKSYHHTDNILTSDGAWENNDTRIRFIKGFLKTAAETTTPLPKEAIKSFTSKFLLDELHNPEMVMLYMNVLQILPKDKCQALLNHSFNRKYSILDYLLRHKSKNDPAYEAELNDLADSMEFKGLNALAAKIRSDASHSRYMVGLMSASFFSDPNNQPSAPTMSEIEEYTPSAPPLPEGLDEYVSSAPSLPVESESFAKDIEVPLAKEIRSEDLEAINVQAFNERLPQRFILHAMQKAALEFRKPPGVFFEWNIVNNLKMIFSWFFNHQQNMRKAEFLDVLANNIKKEPMLPYADHVQATCNILNIDLNTVCRDEKVRRIVDKVLAMDGPVALVENVATLDKDNAFLDDVTKAADINFSPRLKF